MVSRGRGGGQGGLEQPLWEEGVPPSPCDPGEHVERAVRREWPGMGGVTAGDLWG